jgi:hypothetical protein
MTMQQTATPSQSQMQMQEGDDWVCPTCGCEIRLRHHGDPAKMPKMTDFTCCCGTRMEKERHAS